MSAQDELKTDRIAGATTAASTMWTAIRDLEAVVRLLLGLPADTVLSALFDADVSGNVVCQGDFSVANLPTADAHAVPWKTALDIGGPYGVVETAVALDLADSTLTLPVASTVNDNYPDDWIAAAEDDVEIITGGFHFVSLFARFEANNTGLRRIRVETSGAALIEEIYIPPTSATEWTTVNLTFFREFAATDHLVPKVWQSSGGLLECEAFYMWVLRMGPEAAGLQAL